MGALKPWHIAVLVVVLILLFGAKRLPDASRSLGRSLRILKAEAKGLQDDDLAAKAQAQAGRTPYEPGRTPYDSPQQLDSQPSARPVVDPVDRVRDTI
jgi:sec-independent protein translocase protein TatA